MDLTSSALPGRDLPSHVPGPAVVARKQPLVLAPPPRWHHSAELVLRVVAFSAIAAVILIFVFVTKEALPIFFSHEVRKEVTMGGLWLAQKWPGYDEASFIWQPVSDIPKFNLWPLILGTFKVSLISMFLAVPLGVGAAVFLSQYARPRVREVVKPVIELLAGVPSVVLGFFALMVLATWLQNALGLDSRLNAFVAGAALALAVIPIVFTISEEALGAVPRSYVEASIALGAARWQTITKVIVPAASPGIAAAVALGLGRAVGETMIVLMASGNAAIMSINPVDSVRSMSASIAAELAEVVFGGGHYTVLFFIGTLLFLITAGINATGDWAIGRMKRKLGTTS